MKKPTACTEAGKHMIEQLDEAIDHSNTKIRCERVKTVLRDSVESSEELIHREKIMNTSEENDYSRHLLYLDPDERYSLLGMVWQPDQQTPLHDHAGAWCVECVYEGRIEVTSYDVVDEDQHGNFHFQQESNVRSEIGDAGALIPPFEYHKIENSFQKPAITFHVYKGEMTSCNVFLPAEEGGYKKEQKQLSYTHRHLD